MDDGMVDEGHGLALHDTPPPRFSALLTVETLEDASHLSKIMVLTVVNRPDGGYSVGVIAPDWWEL